MIIDVLVADGLDNAWLNYILDCFLSISGANFKFNVCSSENEFVSDTGIVVSYGVKPAASGRRILEIPSSSLYDKDAYCHVSADALNDDRLYGITIPVHSKTVCCSIESGKTLIKFEDGTAAAMQINDCNTKIYFDILYNAFLHISCFEEYCFEEKNHEPTHSRAKKITVGKANYNIPVVNYLFAILEDLIKGIADKSWREILFKNRDSFEICLSHDVDYIEKTPQMVLKNLAFQTYKALGDLMHLRLKESLKKLKRGLHFVFSGCSYWQFDYIQQLEESYGFRSTFFIYVKEKSAGKSHPIRKWLFDPSYDVHENPGLRNKLRKLIEKGWEVGLHGSFDSFDSADMLSGEAKKLAGIIGVPVISTRQHWLRLSFGNTWKVQQDSGIRIDSTLGFNDVHGFRAGAASPFYPYNFYSKKRHNILEIPMVLMDGTLFDHEQLDNEDALDVCITILGEVRKFGGCVAINWHQRTASEDYGWYHVYEEMLKWIKMNGGRGIALKDHGTHQI